MPALQKLLVARDSHEGVIKPGARIVPGWGFRRYPVKLIQMPLYTTLPDGSRLNSFDYACNYRIIERKGENDAVNCMKDKQYSDLLLKTKTNVDLYGDSYRLVYETTPYAILHSKWDWRPPQRLILKRIEELESIATVVWAGNKCNAEKIAFDFFNDAPKCDVESWVKLCSTRHNI